MSGVPKSMRHLRYLVVLTCISSLACASANTAVRQEAILVQSARSSSWPVEDESRPGIWFRFESGPNGPAVGDLLNQLTLTIEHEGRQQVITGAAFALVDAAGSMHQTRYMYLPNAGSLFVTLSLSGSGRQYFPDTQRIELNDDCWHMLNYRVRGAIADEQPYPPPYPRTVFLTAALSRNSPLYLDVLLSGNCFRNPLPPH